MKIVIFGLTITSSWGNGHATLWRGLLRGLAQQGHEPVFFERNVPYYAFHRDITDLPGTRLHLYEDWENARALAARELADADAAIVTSYCADGVQAAALVCESGGHLRVFYDLDTPVTLATIEAGKRPAYIGSTGLAAFDLTLSYTGGASLDELRRVLGARAVEPLYGSVDPEVHYPVPPLHDFAADLSYLGTFAEDRQDRLQRLFIEPARRSPTRSFLLGGSQYPIDHPWPVNVTRIEHVPPGQHPAFYCSSRLTLNITREAMARMGWCPSGRLFEAAACGVPIVSDRWPGMEYFFEPGREIVLADQATDVEAALSLAEHERSAIAHAARARVLAGHTGAQRAHELVDILSAYNARLPAARAS